jgi:hypothetical protein
MSCGSHDLVVGVITYSNVAIVTETPWSQYASFFRLFPLAGPTQTTPILLADLLPRKVANRQSNYSLESTRLLHSKKATSLGLLPLPR